jgi:hypothetical protein
MDAATDGTGADAGGGPGSGVPASGAGGAPEGGDGPSLLAQAATLSHAPAGTPASAPGDPNTFIPEKYRVAGADGKLDLTASAAKVAAAHAELEKKLGNAAARAPEKADDYKADAVLAKIKEATGQDVKLDDAVSKEFREKAHAAGLSQAQYEFVVEQYFAQVQTMVDASFDNAKVKAEAELVKAWGQSTDAAFKANLAGAVKAFNAYAPEALRNPQVMDQIGNNPVVLQILANVGKELGEDTRPNAGGQGGADIAALQNSEAYWNKDHADHARVVAKVSEYYAKGGKNPLKAA